MAYNPFIYKGDMVPKEFTNETKLAKVNLPETKRNYETGNGEGCWAYVEDEETLDLYNKGEGKFSVILCNSSIYHPMLKWGTEIQVEGRGPDRRPVLDWEWFIEREHKYVPSIEEVQEFVSDSEAEFQLEPKNLELLTDAELMSYLDFLSDLWDK